ncbi:hypothetical protein CVIRNUC_005488 [Coccomyxa viridis]|uniref:Uncharacterized protein n=1 Tax=Coccomyxa viridis TaxID=1274662 RepID=A0AAV1I7K7_9CHLO|nr:hypothetical protein CVIRNUC_005488 [Coccomyxa viridis]
MDSKESALQILLAVADRLQLPRKCKFLALTVFTDRAVQCKDADSDVTVAEIYTAAADVLGGTLNSTDLKRIEVWLEPRLDITDMPQLVSDALEDMLKHLERTGMQAFAAATERLLPLCDQILEALHFRQGFQACLTCGGTLLAAAVVGAGVLLSGKAKQPGGYPGVLALLADIAGHSKDVIKAHIVLLLSAILQL